MQSVDLIIHAGWVVPIVPEKTCYQDHAVVVHQGKIVALLPSDEVDKQFSAKETVKRPHHVLMPGFVNCHTHLAMNLLRGLADDLVFVDWLQNYIWPVEGKLVSPEFVCDGTQLALSEMIRGGTTCYNDSYFFQEETARATLEAGFRGVIGLTVLDFPTPWASNQDEYFKKSLAVYEAIKDEEDLGCMWMPHAFYSVGDSTFRRMKEMNEDMQLGIHIHAQETVGEIEKTLNEHGVRPFEYMKNIGLLNDRFLAVHVTNCTYKDYELLQEANAHVVHCPESNMKLASGVCPVMDFKRMGVNVALATDGAASNNDLDMLGEMRSASLLAKMQSRDSESLSAFDSLKMATLDGARALGLSDKIGSLEAGKSADMISIDVSGLEQQPLFHPISQIVYSSVRSQVNDTWVKGKCLMQDRELKTLDEDQLKAKAKAWKTKIEQVL
jgi:5-methylthioadenosine/S-adenosylhomocysteine deaminase